MKQMPPTFILACCQGVSFFSTSTVTVCTRSRYTRESRTIPFVSTVTALERPGRSLTVSFFGTLFFPIACLYLITPILGLNGVWLMPTVSAVASGILTVILALSLRITREK